MNSDSQILFVCPREEQARAFSHLRLAAVLEQSPVLRRVLLGKGSRVQVNNLAFSNGARVFICAAYHSADACRGISANLLLIDEFQDVAAGDLPVLQETLSHAKDGRMILSGTPKTVDNHLQAVFRSSTACEWTLTCAACGNEAMLDEAARLRRYYMFNMPGSSGRQPGTMGTAQPGSDLGPRLSDLPPDGAMAEL